MTVSLPLLKLFERLRKADLLLGVDQYNLAVEALVQSIEDGFDPTDIEAVKRLCQSLWVKSPAEKRIFEQCWEELLSVSATSSKSAIEPFPLKKNEGEIPAKKEEDTLQKDDQSRDTGSEITEEYVTVEAAEMQVGTAVSVFWQESYYFPVSRYQLSKDWKKFQAQKLPTRRTEIDITATVEQVAKAGFFTKPVFTQPATVAKPPEVLLLIDQQGSMTPFHPFCRHLVKIWQKARVYYFQNCPTDALYRDPQLRQTPEDLETVLEKLPSENTVAIIISDAGAAKRRSVPSRWEETVDFLNILTDEVQRVAWLNPLPRCRWFESTAEDIAQIYPEQVPMFALEPLEWEQMIQWLRWGEKSALRFIQHQQKTAKEAWQAADVEESWDLNFDAVSRVNSFAKQYKPAHLELACHAAFPLTITPDLLYRLWQKFFPDGSYKQRLPWYAVADVLLSDLCQPVDTEITELYEIEREIRNELLQRCQSKFGEKRLEELSEFLIDYLDQQIQKPLLPSWLQTLYQMQHWAALAYTSQDEAAQKIAESLKQAYLHNHKSNLVQWSELVATLTPVLPEDKYQPLLVAAKGYGAEARGIKKGTQAARKEWEERFGQEEMASVGGIELAKPGSILGRILLKTFTFKTVTVNHRGEITPSETKEGRYFTEELDNNTPLEMVYIRGGTFTMGAPETERESSNNQRPQHPVTIQPFFMGKYPITQAQWEAVAQLPQIQSYLASNPSGFNGKNRPVEKVSWNHAVEFCARLSQKTSRNYHLPSEAEWEYAGRAGTTTPFHFGETITPELVNYDGNYPYGDAPKGEYRRRTTPVGSFPANAFGLYDMHGNVWEWCQDSWHDNYNGAPSDGSAWERGGDSNKRLMRGGSWKYLAVNCRAAYRGYNSPGYRDNGIGFRVVCSGAWTS